MREGLFASPGSYLAVSNVCGGFSNAKEYAYSRSIKVRSVKANSKLNSQANLKVKLSFKKDNQFFLKTILSVLKRFLAVSGLKSQAPGSGSEPSIDNWLL